VRSWKVLALAQTQAQLMYADVPKPAVSFAELYAKRTNVAQLSLHHHCHGGTACLDGWMDVWLTFRLSSAGIGCHINSLGAAGYTLSTQWQEITTSLKVHLPQILH
jgi:hypothetical protein